MFKKVWHFFEMLGTARAAAELSRKGYVEQAKNLMVEHAKIKQTIKELNALSDKELNDIGINRGEIWAIAHGIKS